MDSEEGYPGNLHTTVNYFLTTRNELVIEYLAKTDQSTIVNLTNHYYFNLTGGIENILNHYLTVPASAYTELNDLMPTGRYVEVWTTQPALQIYAGYFIPDLIVNGKKSFGRYSGFALETQHFADAINHSHFPSIVLNPDEPFYQKTVYRFGILED